MSNRRARQAPSVVKMNPLQAKAAQNQLLASDDNFEALLAKATGEPVGQAETTPIVPPATPPPKPAEQVASEATEQVTPEVKPPEPKKVDEPKTQPDIVSLDDIRKQSADLLGDDEETEEPVAPTKERPATTEEKPKAADDRVDTDPNLSERAQARIRELASKVKERDAKLAEVESKLKELEANAATPVKADPLTDEERRRLFMLERRFSLETDETIRKTFDEPIKEVSEGVNAIIDRYVEDKEQAKRVKDMGIVEFAKKYPHVYSDFLAELQTVSPVDASIITSAISDVTRLQRNKQAHVQKVSADVDTYFKEQEELRQKQIKEQQEYQNSLVQHRQQFLSSLNEDKLFAPLSTAGLSGEALVKAESENKRRANYRATAQKLMDASTPEEIKAVVYRATLVDVYADAVRKLKAELDKAKSKEDKTREKQAHRSPQKSPAPAPESRALSFEEKLKLAAEGKYKVK